MSVKRGEHTATVLPGGRILIIGGRDGSDTHDSTETFDPAAQTWKPGASMRHPRGGHTATLLSDGRVIVVGGGGAIPSNTTEIFDPISDTWTMTASLLAPRRGHTTTLLPNGNLIVAGGKGPGCSRLSPEPSCTCPAQGPGRPRAALNALAGGTSRCLCLPRTPIRGSVTVLSRAPTLGRLSCWEATTPTVGA